MKTSILKKISGIGIACYYSVQSYFQPSREMMAIWTKEYDDIRSALYLCVSSGSLLVIEKRIKNFEHRAKAILPKELYKIFCGHLKRLFDAKEVELIDMELELYQFNFHKPVFSLQ